MQMNLALAASVNSEPLPLVGEGYGIRLPPRSQRLTATSFNVVPNAPPLHDDLEEELDQPPTVLDPAVSTTTTATTTQRIKQEPGAVAQVPQPPPPATRMLEEESDYDEVEPATAPAAVGGDTAEPSSVPSSGAPLASEPPPPLESRGVKRALEEDEDYD